MGKIAHFKQLRRDFLHSPRIFKWQALQACWFIFRWSADSLFGWSVDQVHQGNSSLGLGVNVTVHQHALRVRNQLSLKIKSPEQVMMGKQWPRSQKVKCACIQNAVKLEMRYWHNQVRERGKSKQGEDKTDYTTAKRIILGCYFSNESVPQFEYINKL